MFSEIIGNDPIKENLSRHIASGRVSNALLFTGPDGVGKRLFALDMARAFLCSNRAAGEPCGKCSACIRAGQFEFPKDGDKDARKKVISSNHADVGIVISHNRNILVDAIRDLEKEAYFRPYEGRARFFLIDDADKMNDAAANALLKTLEEPSSTSHLILLTSRPDTLLATIRSRCQTVRFAPVETQTIERFLINKGILSGDDSKLAARLAFGSVGKALSLDLPKLRQQREMLLRTLHDAIVSRDSISLFFVSEKLSDAKHKEDFEENLDILLVLIRDIWTLELGGGKEQIINIDIFFELEQLAQNIDTCVLGRWMSEIEVVRENLIVNINKRIATDALFVKMAAR